MYHDGQNLKRVQAEPDTRLERGIDVAFPVSKFEQVGVTQWDGVRSHEVLHSLRAPENRVLTL